MGVRALTTRPRVSGFSQPLTFVPSSVSQPIAPTTLAQHRPVFVALSTYASGVSRSAAVPPKQNKSRPWAPYAQRLRHRQGARRSAPPVCSPRMFSTRFSRKRTLLGPLLVANKVRHSCHSVSGDNFTSTWTNVHRVSWSNTEQPRSSAPHHWVAEHRSARPRSGSGVLLLFLFIQTSTHHSLYQHRLADDQPAAATHELSEHRLLSSRRGGAQITRITTKVVLVVVQNGLLEYVV
jgi:hypothetical protein